ncbi:MAG: hypothetical protein B7Z47_02320 [Chthoniobacter sp. 12-60-6]|nr:MAG: hypothetical protein B7Z47_02320 [Chthoniobacter sp. 12-60-6]
MKNRSITAVLAALAISSTAVFAAPDNTQNAGSKWLVDASKLEGTEVWDFHGNKLGDLQQVLIDPQTGRIRYGVMEVDKSWSWADPQVAIPWDAFAVKRGDDMKTTLSVDATKDKLQKAPKFKAGDADRLFSKEASQPIYSYWSIYWYDDPAAGTTSNANSPASTQSNTNSPASTQTNADSPASTQSNANSTGATQTNGNANKQGETSGTAGSGSTTNSPGEPAQNTTPKQ